MATEAGMELPDAALKIGAPGKGKHFQKDFFYRLVESRWYARLQLEATKRFSRESLWTRVDGSAIAPTIIEFLNQNRGCV